MIKALFSLKMRNSGAYVNCLITDNLLVSKKKLIFLGYLKKY